MPSLKDYFPVGGTKVGFQTVGGRVESDPQEGLFFLRSTFPASMTYHPACRLQITISINSDFSDSKKYYTEFYKSGSVPLMDIPFVVEGTHYIKAVVEDKLGNTSQEYLWSVWVAQTMTIYDIRPVNGSQVNIGVLDITAGVASNTYYNEALNEFYKPNCRSEIHIADNTNYIDATIYSSEWQENESFFEIQHPIKRPGTYYLKLIAEDKNGARSDPVEYTLTAIHHLYFLKKPSVRTQAPQANSVIVKILNSDPVIEYVAKPTPEPSPEGLIERLIYIDQGDLNTCQSVAEALLGRWGREQISVSGLINLTVTLSFKERVRIIIPEAGINTEMILQRKQHNVTKGETTVMCGDLILNDNELLARILDELGGR